MKTRFHTFERAAWATSGCLLALVALTFPWLRREDGWLDPLGALLLIAGLSLVLVGIGWRTRWQRCASLLAVAVVGQACMLQLLEVQPPPMVAYQRYLTVEGGGRADQGPRGVMLTGRWVSCFLSSGAPEQQRGARLCRYVTEQSDRHHPGPLHLGLPGGQCRADADRDVHPGRHQWERDDPGGGVTVKITVRTKAMSADAPPQPSPVGRMMRLRARRHGTQSSSKFQRNCRHVVFTAMVAVTMVFLNARSTWANVTLTSPAAPSLFTAPANINLVASVTGTYVRVEFYANATKIGEDSTAPYTLTWNGASPGSYSLTARGIDGGGAATISAPVAVNVSSAGQQGFSDPSFSSELVTTLGAFTPVGLAWSPDGRLFIVQKSGIIRVVKNGVLQPTPFLDIRSRVYGGSDSGLLGLAFHPDFTNNGYFYVSYVFQSNPLLSPPKTSHISRFSIDPSNPDTALTNSEVVILGTVDTPPCSSHGPGADCIPADFPYHTIATLRFAPDGKLFVGNGDSAHPGGADNLAMRSQDLDLLAGKILRINDDGSAPTDNPFYDGTNSNRSKVWAYGVRNPYRFSVNPATGEPFVGDVGWNTWEEVNRATRGANLGWPCYEGVARQPMYNSAEYPLCQALQPSQVTPPLIMYGRSVGSSVTGGIFYTGDVYPELYRGNYFFADYTGDWIKRASFDAQGNLASIHDFAGTPTPVSLEWVLMGCSTTFPSHPARSAGFGTTEPRRWPLQRHRAAIRH